MRCDENIAPYEIQFIKPIKYRADAHIGPIILSPLSLRDISPHSGESPFTREANRFTNAKRTDTEVPVLLIDHRNLFLQVGFYGSQLVGQFLGQMIAELCVQLLNALQLFFPSVLIHI